MILTRGRIEELGLVEGVVPGSLRATTYDATVGEILNKGEGVSSNEFVLPPRGMVWVVSNETFKLPASVTGVATLRTTWTHQGILALNVGIIDPNWHGQLAAALVNFSNRDFKICKSDAFLRVAFFEHAAVPGVPIVSLRKEEYLIRAMRDSSRMPSTFLDLDSVALDVFDKLNSSVLFGNKLTKIGLFIAIAAVIAGFVATMVPIAIDVYRDSQEQQVAIEVMRKKVEDIGKKQDEMGEGLRRMQRRTGSENSIEFRYKNSN